MQKDLKIYASEIDGGAINQIYEIANLKAFEEQKIRIMPDAHQGAGCVIGFTGTYTDKIIPNITGVDLNCGMLIVNIGKVDLDLEKIDNFIKKEIPMGRNVNKKPYKNAEMLILNKKIEEMHCYKELKEKQYLLNSVGSLGGGNHFIEIDKDEDDNKYIVIHSGSRNLGKQVADIYQKLAIKECHETFVSREEIKEIANKLKKQGKQKEIPNAISKYSKDKGAKEPGLPNDICYLEGKSMQDYIDDIQVCKMFANMSRRYMMQKIIEFIFSDYGMKDNSNTYVESDCSISGYDDSEINVRFESFETLHNYVDTDAKIIRKGAIRALEDERVLIPINMRDGSLICVGKGNTDWNNSAPHGAGRLLSRSEAKELIKLKDYEESMKGIYTSSVNDSTIDESPFVYKSIDTIMKDIKDTVEIEKRITPIYNCKASE